jgi:hypothetical protein
MGGAALFQEKLSGGRFLYPGAALHLPRWRGPKRGGFHEGATGQETPLTVPPRAIACRSARFSKFAHGSGNVCADAIARITQWVSVQTGVALRCAGLRVQRSTRRAFVTFEGDSAGRTRRGDRRASAHLLGPQDRLLRHISELYAVAAQ